MSNQTKAVVSVAEMAGMVGLSRQRFYQLMGKAFPYPVYDLASKRPFYTEEMQQVCIEVRRRNFGIDGRPVMFYAMGPCRQRPVRRTKQPVKRQQYAGLIEGLAALGLSSVTDQQVGAAVMQLYPDGTDGKDQGEVLRSVFLFMRRKDTADNVAR